MGLTLPSEQAFYVFCFMIFDIVLVQKKDATWALLVTHSYNGTECSHNFLLAALQLWSLYFHVFRIHL